MKPLEEIESFDEFFKLKSVYRLGTVGDRHESSAEHSWSCLLVADFLLDKVDEELDRQRIYELLMYHDLVEAECGDTPTGPAVDKSRQASMEAAASTRLAQRLPEPIATRFRERFEEFELQETREAQFAKVVDGFEADVYTRRCDIDWSGWTLSYHDSKRRAHFEQFPQLVPYLDVLQRRLVEQGILDEEE